MAWSGWKLTWVLMRALCSLLASHSVFEPGVGEADKGNGTKLCVADMSAVYLHLKRRNAHTLQPVSDVYRAQAGARTVSPHTVDKEELRE